MVRLHMLQLVKGGALNGASAHCPPAGPDDWRVVATPMSTALLGSTCDACWMYGQSRAASPSAVPPVTGKQCGVKPWPKEITGFSLLAHHESELAHAACTRAHPAAHSVQRGADTPPAVQKLSSKNSAKTHTWVSCWQRCRPRCPCTTSTGCFASLFCLN